jgi:hypothetical protein
MPSTFPGPLDSHQFQWLTIVEAGSPSSWKDRARKLRKRPESDSSNRGMTAIPSSGGRKRRIFLSRSNAAADARGNQTRLQGVKPGCTVRRGRKTVRCQRKKTAYELFTKIANRSVQFPPFARLSPIVRFGEPEKNSRAGLGTLWRVPGSKRLCDSRLAT